MVTQRRGDARISSRLPGYSVATKQTTHRPSPDQPLVAVHEQFARGTVALFDDLQHLRPRSG
jgi:hypothetical protein